ncbi:MAG: hypothetical protein PVH00_09390 [Gemmatimonadota bacterium]
MTVVPEASRIVIRAGSVWSVASQYSITIPFGSFGVTIRASP